MLCSPFFLTSFFSFLSFGWDLMCCQKITFFFLYIQSLFTPARLYFHHFKPDV